MSRKEVCWKLKSRQIKFDGYHFFSKYKLQKTKAGQLKEEYTKLNPTESGILDFQT